MAKCVKHGTEILFDMDCNPFCNECLMEKSVPKKVSEPKKVEKKKKK